jgi:hypothetical protein
VADQIQQVRGLRFRRAVTPEPVSKQRIGRLLVKGLNEQFPAAEEARRRLAWATIGAIPPQTDLHRAILDFGASQIIGFYDTDTHQLVFVGGQSLTPLERLTLAHELTHALDDQAFDLSRLDDLARACRDDRAGAFLALTEGDAVVSSLLWAIRHLSAAQRESIARDALGASSPPASVPPFLEEELTFPYPNGQAFVEALLRRGGEGAVNRAFRQPPASTEQILHPAKYPGDAPQDVEVADLSRLLGKGWKDLDVQDVGEGWLRDLLALGLPDRQSSGAAAGWDGGQYRAWSRGSSVAVLMETVWDSAGEASEFGRAMKEWLGGRTAQVVQEGSSVRVFFASDLSTLRSLQQAAG